MLLGKLGDWPRGVCAETVDGEDGAGGLDVNIAGRRCLLVLARRATASEAAVGRRDSVELVPSIVKKFGSDVVWNLGTISASISY